MRSTPRSALILAAAVALAIAPGAAASAPGPNTLTVEDPVGDDIAPHGASDLIGMTVTTTGTGEGHAYEATRLVVTLTLAGKPASDGTVRYGFEMQVPGCGEVSLEYTPGAVVDDHFNYADCGGGVAGEGAPFEIGQKVKGDSIVWTLPFAAVPFELGRGASLSALLGSTDAVDPAFGHVGGNTVGIPLYDVVGADEDYVVG